MMREAFSLIELLFALSLLGIALTLGIKLNTHTPLILASQSLLNAIKYTQNLALRDHRFFPNPQSVALTLSLSPSINPNALLASPTMWQIQFHLSGIYTQNSYSIYIDTPRHSKSTNLDGRPMSGDFIALDSSNNQCLSGYNNSNISSYCKNNASLSVRLKERFGVEKITLSGDRFCSERDGGRIYFDDFGVPHCGKSPRPLTQTYKITLYKGREIHSICIAPITGLSSFCSP